MKILYKYPFCGLSNSKFYLYKDTNNHNTDWLSNNKCVEMYKFRNPISVNALHSISIFCSFHADYICNINSSNFSVKIISTNMENLRELFIDIKNGEYSNKDIFGYRDMEKLNLQSSSLVYGLAICWNGPSDYLRANNFKLWCNIGLLEDVEEVEMKYSDGYLYGFVPKISENPGNRNEFNVPVRISAKLNSGMKSVKNIKIKVNNEIKECQPALGAKVLRDNNNTFYTEAVKIFKFTPNFTGPATIDFPIDSTITEEIDVSNYVDIDKTIYPYDCIYNRSLQVFKPPFFSEEYYFDSLYGNSNCLEWNRPQDKSKDSMKINLMLVEGHTYYILLNTGPISGYTDINSKPSSIFVYRDRKNFKTDRLYMQSDNFQLGADFFNYSSFHGSIVLPKESNIENGVNINITDYYNDPTGLILEENSKVSDLTFESQDADLYRRGMFFKFTPKYTRYYNILIKNIASSYPPSQRIRCTVSDKFANQLLQSGYISNSNCPTSMNIYPKLNKGEDYYIYLVSYDNSYTCVPDIKIIPRSYSFYYTEGSSYITLQNNGQSIFNNISWEEHEAYKYKMTFTNPGIYIIESTSNLRDPYLEVYNGFDPFDKLFHNDDGGLDRNFKCYIKITNPGQVLIFRFSNYLDTAGEMTAIYPNTINVSVTRNDNVPESYINVSI